MSQVETSNRKIESNRRNALKSTGPKSERGKSIVGQNAVKHGLRSADPLKANAKSPGQMQRFVAALRDDLQPQGAMQELVFERIANLAWRLQRVQQTETRLLKHDRKSVLDEFEEEPQYAPELQMRSDRTRLRDTSLLAEHFMATEQTGNHYLLLRRYEASFERSLFKAINELKKLQGKCEK